MPARTLWCNHCNAGYASVGPTDLPAWCPNCDQEAVWRTTSKTWALTANDIKLLKSMKILAD